MSLPTTMSLPHVSPLSHGVVLIGIRSAFGNGDSSATFEMKGAAVSNAFRGYSTFSSFFAAALPRGAVVSQGNFGFGHGTSLPRLRDYVCDFPDWQEPGTYYLGFRFNTGSGRHYGWMRIKWQGCTDSGEPHNKFVVRDYAWGDVGDQVKTGQKQLLENETQVAPAAAKSAGAAPLSGAQGSLGLLALGAVGLQAWRRSRRAE